MSALRAARTIDHDTHGVESVGEASHELGLDELAGSALEGGLLLDGERGGLEAELLELVVARLEALREDRIECWSTTIPLQTAIEAANKAKTTHGMHSITLRSLEPVSITGQVLATPVPLTWR